MRARLVGLRAAIAERGARARAAWRGERGIVRLLAIETAVTVPFFLLSWLLSSIVFAIVSGWRLAKLETAKKRLVLEKLYGVTPKPGDSA